jgi:hypothetical protein
MVLALIVLSALGTLGSLTVVSVQGVLKASTNDRSAAIARYAAESGAAAAMDALRRHYDLTRKWSALVHQFNSDPVLPLATSVLPSNGALPTTPNNLFSPDQNAWFSVAILNNANDIGFSDPTGSNDLDGQVIIQSTGHGPQGAMAIIEWEVRRMPQDPNPAQLPAPIPPQKKDPADPDLPNSTEPPLILMGWREVF